MLWLADAGLAAAISNAGGLGVISPLAGADPHGDAAQNLALQINRIRHLTTKPFGVNLPLDLRDLGLLMDLVLTQQVGVVVTAAGDPGLYTDVMKSRGAIVLHVVSNVRQAIKAQAAGVDAVIAEGVEAAARNGVDEIPLFSLIPQIVEAVEIPVIAAGGIVDARGAVAAMALGAAGIQMGTRFLMSAECIAHPAYKEAILKAKDADTAIFLRRLIPSRSLKNTLFSQSLAALEADGASADTLKDFIGHAASRKAGLDGDLESGEAYCGASSGLISDIPTVEEIIRRIAGRWGEIVRGLEPDR